MGCINSVDSVENTDEKDKRTGKNIPSRKSSITRIWKEPPKEYEVTLKPLSEWRQNSVITFGNETVTIRKDSSTEEIRKSCQRAAATEPASYHSSRDSSETSSGSSETSSGSSVTTQMNPIFQLYLDAAT